MKAIAEPSTVSAATLLGSLPTPRPTKHLLDSTTSPGNALGECKRRLPSTDRPSAFQVLPLRFCHPSQLLRGCEAYKDKLTHNK